MIFHENRQLADDSHELSFLISFENWERCHKICRLLQLLLALLGLKEIVRSNLLCNDIHLTLYTYRHFCGTYANSADPDHLRRRCGV